MRSALLNNLQFRVAVVFLLVSLVPLGIVGVFSVQTADRVIASIVSNQLENMAEEKSELLERWLTERKADVAVVARSSPVRSLDPAQIASYLELVRAQYGVYNRFVVMGAEGRTVYDSAGASKQVNGQEKQCYQHALETGAYVSNVTWDPSGEVAVFRIAEAIRGPDGKTLGTVCATVNTQAILGRVLQVSLGETGECYLVDDAGTFLAHREPQRILKENIAQSESFANIFSASSGPIYTDYRGIAVLGASRPVAGMPWFVVVEQDRDEAFASSYRMARNIRIVLAATALCAIGLSWVLASYVSSPIRALSEAALALSRGDFEHALVTQETRRSDEIGALDAAFRHMANQIWDRHTKMQRRIGFTEEELRKSEAKLKETLQAAARSERLAALGRLSSGVAHEIRTPLASLKLFLQSMREDMMLSPDQAEDFDVAMRQVRRMEATINHFLNFARPQEPFLAEVNFEKLVDDALLVVKPRANQQEVEVVRAVGADLPKVEGDVRQLGEALVNLLVNALEVMPDGGRLSICVAAEPAPADDSSQPRVRIEVSDTGPGIREGDLERLFEPFFTTKATGSGLGLAIVHGTVERHGGTIEVQSKPGVGTRFVIRLPGMAGTC